MADDLNDLLRRKGLMDGMINLRPTEDRPLVHQSDPKMLDYGLGKVSENLMGPAMLLGGAVSGGPEALALKNLLPGIMQGLVGPYTKADPNILQDPVYPMFHGTAGAFEEFDPEFSKDLGVHFGTLEQAQQRAQGITFEPDMWKQVAEAQKLPGMGGIGYKKGANIRPVDVEVENPVRLPDRFSMGISRRNLVWELLGSADDMKMQGFKEPGLQFSPENKQAMLDWMISGQGTEKDLWKIVEKQIKESGHDSVVYQNESEGKGDSIIVFDPKKAKPRFGSYDPSGLGKK